MPDREKVIKGLECCAAYDYKCNDCPYQDDGGAEDGCYSDELKTDALALLRAQDPMVMAGAELTDAELIEEIRKAPIVLKPNVDAVPVVRCRDCKYYDRRCFTCENDVLLIKIDDCGCHPPFRVDDDWYCADGERRDKDAVD